MISYFRLALVGPLSIVAVSLCLLGGGCNRKADESPSASSRGAAFELVGTNASGVLTLGVVPLQRKEMHFSVRNSGTDPLNITSIRPSCSKCTIIEMPKTLGPGEIGSITISVAITSPGPGAARVDVDSNAADSPHTFLINWFGEHPPRLYPQLLFADVDRGAKMYESIVSIVYVGGDPTQSVIVKSASTSIPELSVDLAGPTTSIYNRDAKALNQIAVARELPYTIRCTFPASNRSRPL